MSTLRELYQEIILDHNRNPRNFKIISDATRKVEGYNPLCGDHYVLYVKIIDDVIIDIGFQGSGCAISKASASVMCSTVNGKTVKEALMLFEKFHDLVLKGSKSLENNEKIGKLEAFAGVSEFPARVKCATLAWHTLKSAIESDKDVVSTE